MSRASRPSPTPSCATRAQPGAPLRTLTDSTERATRCSTAAFGRARVARSLRGSLRRAVSTRTRRVRLQAQRRCMWLRTAVEGVCVAIFSTAVASTSMPRTRRL
eukprot:Amastigsp_a842195_17.p3 type:complete len:104 gc:universal Amastigsp_a842195_17:1205-894(-)